MLKTFNDLQNSFDLCEQAAPKATKAALIRFKENAEMLCWGDGKYLVFPTSHLTMAFIRLPDEQQNTLVDFFKLKPLHAATPEEVKAKGREIARLLLDRKHQPA
ncbi:MAG: hypothetical protein FWF24_04545 [Alphaproteobacteria bacterium]|nr:hypothetical protein [Alphaproteobacteria bacterium]